MLIPSMDVAHHYDHVYIAPHLDDAVLSCSGRITTQADAGEAVLVVTICAGSPPQDSTLSPFAQYLHGAWGLGNDPIVLRREEDTRALSILGCDGLHLDQLDAPYRVAAYGVGDGWRGSVAPDDPLIAASAVILAQLHAQQPRACFYVPLGVGNHVDHQIVCAAGIDAWERRISVVWYEDAPYAAKQPDAIQARLMALAVPFAPDVIAIESVLLRKLDAINVYQSQLRELFGDADMAQMMTAYAATISETGGFGERVWRRT